MNSKLIGGVTEFLNTERELQEVSPPPRPAPLVQTLLFASSFAVSENLNLKGLLRHFSDATNDRSASNQRKKSILESQLEAEKIKLVLERVVWREKRGDGWRSAV